MDGARDSSNDYEGTLVVSPETETGYCYPVKVVQRLIVNLGLFLLPRVNSSALTCFILQTILQIHPPPSSSLSDISEKQDLQYRVLRWSWELNVKSKNNLNDLLIRQFKLPSAVETRMANLCRETKEIKGEGI